MNIIKKNQLFSNHSAVKREQIIFILNIIRRRQESGLGISFIDMYSYHSNTQAVKLQKYKGRSQETVKHNTDHTMKSNLNNFVNHKKYSKEIVIHSKKPVTKKQQQYPKIKYKEN